VGLGIALWDVSPFILHSFHLSSFIFHLMKLKTATGSIDLESNQYDVVLVQRLGIESATLVHYASYGTYSEYTLYHPGGGLLPFRAILNDSSFWFHIEPTHDVFLLLI